MFFKFHIYGIRPTVFVLGEISFVGTEEIDLVLLNLASRELVCRLKIYACQFYIDLYFLYSL